MRGCVATCLFPIECYGGMDGIAPLRSAIARREFGVQGSGVYVATSSRRTLGIAGADLVHRKMIELALSFHL